MCVASPCVLDGVIGDDRQLCGERFAAPVIAVQVLDAWTLRVAANKALHSVQVGSSKAASLHAEVVYSLAPSKGVGPALGTFGVQPQSKAVIVAVMDGTTESRAAVASDIEGNVSSIAAFDAESTSPAKQEHVASIYGISAEEMATTVSLSDSVVTRMAVRDVVRTNASDRKARKARKKAKKAQQQQQQQ